MSDFQLVRLALARGTSESIRSMAMYLNEDCNQAMVDIEKVATQNKLALPASLDDEHNELLQRMGEATGADFDSAYIEQTALRHRDALRLFKRGQTIKIPEISALASRALAMIEAQVKLSRRQSGSIDSLLM